MAEWLKITPSYFRWLVKAGVLPQGKPRFGGKRRVWTRQEAGVCKWIVDNIERFNRAEMPQEQDPEEDEPSSD